MSGKNRAFALAVATAALVGLSAPVASAASFQGPTSGFNGDSVLNVSGNQLPIQACNNSIPVNVLGVQVPLSAISAALGLLNSGTVASSATQSCTQNPTQSDATTVNTNSPTTTTTPTDPNMGGGNWGGGDHHSGWKGNDPMNSSNDPATDGTSGFNGDSVLNLSNNQVPVQACNNDIPVNVLGVQVPVTGASGALGLLNSGTVGSSADRTCTQTPSQTNPTTISTNS
jgi:hypothetical protein